MKTFKLTGRYNGQIVKGVDFATAVVNANAITDIASGVNYNPQECTKSYPCVVAPESFDDFCQQSGYDPRYLNSDDVREINEKIGKTYYESEFRCVCDRGVNGVRDDNHNILIQGFEV